MEKTFEEFYKENTRESIKETADKDFEAMLNAARDIGIDMGEKSLGPIKEAMLRAAALRRDDKFMDETVRITAAAIDALLSAGLLSEKTKNKDFLLSTGVFVIINALIALEHGKIIKINV